MLFCLRKQSLCLSHLLWLASLQQEQSQYCGTGELSECVWLGDAFGTHLSRFSHLSAVDAGLVTGGSSAYAEALLCAGFEEVSGRGLAAALQRRQGLEGFLDLHTSTGLKASLCAALP